MSEQPSTAAESGSTSTSQDDGARRPRKPKFQKFGQKRKEVEPEEPLDYKNWQYLQRFIGPTGKIVSRRRSNFSGQNQRKLAAAIKRARIVGLLPFVGKG